MTGTQRQDAGQTGGGIVLYRFGPAMGLVDASPFCMKVELYLRAAGLPFSERCGLRYLPAAPKRKLPFIRDRGRTVADSSFIIEYLKRHYGDPLDQDLSGERRAIAHACIRMIEENLYWCIVHNRWVDPANWPCVRDALFGHLPVPVRAAASGLARRAVRRALYQQGLGRHRDSEVVHIGLRDLHALSVLLGEKRYFLGDTLTGLDISAWAFLACVYAPRLDGELNRQADRFANLRAFVEGIGRRYYPEGPARTVP